MMGNNPKLIRRHIFFVSKFKKLFKRTIFYNRHVIDVYRFSTNVIVSPIAYKQYMI